MKVYLAGGMKSGWQDKVIQAYPGIEFLDPRTHGLTDPMEYTQEDMRMIEEADVVFAYMEESNPGGYALGLEVGYALGLNKSVIWSDDLSEQRGRYFNMLRCAVQDRQNCLNAAIILLGNYQ